jgi:hypothetical protein
VVRDLANLRLGDALVKGLGLEGDKLIPPKIADEMVALARAGTPEQIAAALRALEGRRQLASGLLAGGVGGANAFIWD